MSSPRPGSVEIFTTEDSCRQFIKGIEEGFRQLGRSRETRRNQEQITDSL